MVNKHYHVIHNMLKIMAEMKEMCTEAKSLTQIIISLSSLATDTIIDEVFK